MGIDNIKPPGGPGPFADPSAEMPSERKGNFADVKDSLPAAGFDPPAPAGLGALSQFSRSSLEDPEKRQAMVRACVSELIDSDRTVTGPLSDAEKQSLLDFLSSDPLLRNQIENYLQKVLV